QVFLHGRDLDGAVAPVSIEIGRFVGDVILAAQFLFDGGERARNVFHLVREEGAAASGGGEVFENLVAAQDQTAVVGGDGVNEYLSPLRHFNRLSPCMFALVVFAVAKDDDRLANGMIGTLALQLFLAGFVDGIVERGAAAVRQALHSGGQQRHL